jgi:lactoylglutathione lyase
MNNMPAQNAAPKILALNHVALHVADTARSAAFYEQVLKLERLPRPGFSFPGAWFSLGPAQRELRQELHLIEDASYPLQAWHRRNHFALLIEDAEAWLTHLHRLGLSDAKAQRRPDGALQIFLADPDGHFVELCTEPLGRGARGS